MTDDKFQRLYKLSANPFSQRANPKAPMVGRTQAQEWWSTIIEGAVGQRGSSLNFIEGDYGLGKTLSLYHIRNLCESRDDVACVFIKLMTEDPVKNFGLDIGRRIFKTLPEATLAKLAKAKATGIKRDHLPHFNVISKYARRLSPYHEVMTGGTPTAKELKDADIRRPQKSAEAMFEYLTVLLVMMHSVGLSSLVLCIDEAEYIFSQLSSKKAALVFNAIRSMYDLPDTANLGLEYAAIANIIFFFAISASGAGALKRMEQVESHQGGPIQPLLSRSAKTIALAFLDKAETKDLVKQYLHTRRTGTKEKDPLIPYDESFVDYLFHLTKGHPRRIIERCDYVLIEGLQANVPLLTKQFAKGVFEKLRITD